MKFKATGAGNSILEGDGFFISFLLGSLQPPVVEVIGLFASLVSGDESYTKKQDETALVTQVDGKRIFRILNGDFRNDYKGIASQGLDACIAFYESQRPDHGSIWSTGDL